MCSPFPLFLGFVAIVPGVLYYEIDILCVAYCMWLLPYPPALVSMLYLRTIVVSDTIVHRIVYVL
jgi:hypothetical protein